MKLKPQNDSLIILITFILLNIGVGLLMIQFSLPLALFFAPGILIIFAALFYPLWLSLSMTASLMITGAVLFSYMDVIYTYSSGILGVISFSMVIFCLTTHEQQKKHHEAREALLDFTNLLQLAFEETEDGIWDWNPISNEINLSPNFATSLGLESPKPPIFFQNNELIHHQDLDPLKKIIKEHFKETRPNIQAEIRIKKQDGKWSWVLIRGKASLRSPDGKPTRVIGTVVDINQMKLYQESLRQSEKTFRQLTENMREAYWVRDRNTHKLIYISPGITNESKISIKEMQDEPTYYYNSIHPEDVKRIRRAEELLYKNGTPLTEEYRFFHKDGTTRWLISRQYPIYNENGDFYRVAGVSEDITDRKIAELALVKSEKRYRNLVEHQGEGVIIVNDKEDFVFTNPAAGEILGTHYKSLLGRNWFEFLDPEQTKILKAQTAERQKGLESTYELICNCPDGKRKNLLVTVTPRFDKENQFSGGIGVIRDITERSQKVEALLYTSFHDTLTGIYNRAFFQKTIENFEKCPSERPISVIMVDVDNLKLINDQYGHSMGDHLLVEVATVLQESFRDKDVVARIGGDEFAVLMPETNEQVLEQIIQRVREKIHTKNAQSTGNLVLFSISLGGVVRNGSEPLIETLDRADKKMYIEKAKKKQNSALQLPLLRPVTSNLEKS